MLTPGSLSSLSPVSQVWCFQIHPDDSFTALLSQHLLGCSDLLRLSTSATLTYTLYNFWSCHFNQLYPNHLDLGKRNPILSALMCQNSKELSMESLYPPLNWTVLDFHVRFRNCFEILLLLESSARLHMANHSLLETFSSLGIVPQFRFLILILNVGMFPGLHLWPLYVLSLVGSLNARASENLLNSDFRIHSSTDDLNLTYIKLESWFCHSLLKYISSPFITIFEVTFYFLLELKPPVPWSLKSRLFYTSHAPGPLFMPSAIPHSYHLPTSWLLLFT